MGTLPFKAINVHEVLNYGAVVFGDAETDIMLTWNGDMEYNVFAGRFDGRYDLIDTFHRETGDIKASRLITQEWFRQHATFNPGP